MATFLHRTVNSQHVVDVQYDSREIVYSSVPHGSAVAAEKSARSWYTWSQGVPTGETESIYYILGVPITWSGPPPGGHRYSGVHFKIGRTKNVEKRLQNLRTGTSEDLIIHALEPGNAERETELHEQFKSDRRQGEWFAASRFLCQHVLATWQKNRILPPEHQTKIVQFAERSRIYAGLRASGASFDMINPSLNDDWHGSVFVDLVNTPLCRSTEKDTQKGE
jgi:hypothetical protein